MAPICLLKTLFHQPSASTGWCTCHSYSTNTYPIGTLCITIVLYLVALSLIFCSPCIPLLLHFVHIPFLLGSSIGPHILFPSHSSSLMLHWILLALDSIPFVFHFLPALLLLCLASFPLLSRSICHTTTTAHAIPCYTCLPALSTGSCNTCLPALSTGSCSLQLCPPPNRSLTPSPTKMPSVCSC
jgi:hypothetical protein